jgi:hypothetical protein
MAQGGWALPPRSGTEMATIKHGNVATIAMLAINVT